MGRKEYWQLPFCRLDENKGRRKEIIPALLYWQDRREEILSYTTYLPKYLQLNIKDIPLGVCAHLI